MATFRFTEQPRKKNSNEPLTYTITEPDGTAAGTLRKQKNKWRLHWRGVAAEFESKMQMRRHFSLMGHRVEGIA